MPVNWYSVNRDFRLNGIDFIPVQISPFEWMLSRLIGTKYYGTKLDLTGLTTC